MATSRAAAAPVRLPASPQSTRRNPSLLVSQLSSSSLNFTRSSGQSNSPHNPLSPRSPISRSRQSNSREQSISSPDVQGQVLQKSLADASNAMAKAQSRSARKLNDSMVYLDGPQIYACAQCRTHLTSHDEIISKSFHGRHGRAYLFDNCVNVSIGPAEDRLLITGLHSVCDIFCKRCKTMVGWTYAKAYEASQKYKEGKYIVEKINLHLEESDYYDIAPPAGERSDRFRARSISWGSACSSERHETVYEYGPERQSSVSSAGVGLGSH